MIRDHLSFVVDNWHLLSYAIPERKRIKYIITAFNSEVENEQIEQLQNLKTSVDRALTDQTAMIERLLAIDKTMDD